MYKKILNDIYPVSEARQRFKAECWRWIYLPIIACLVVVIGVAFALAGSHNGAGLSHWAQLAMIAFTGIFIVAGLFVLPFLLAFVWTIEELLGVLPVFTGRMRMNVVLTSYRVQKIFRGINRIAGFLFGAPFTRRREVNLFRRATKTRGTGKGGL
jgi:hypothetical protein